MTEEIVYRYLRFRSRRGFVRGITLCRHLRIPTRRLRDLDDYEGLGSFGPVVRRPIKLDAHWNIYAKRNGYMASPRFLFELDGRLWCIKTRPLRAGKLPPRLKTVSPS